MFETAIITESYFDLFAKFDPFEFLRYGSEPDRVCLGTVLTGKKGEKDEPVGLMVCRNATPGIVLEWLFVHTQYRDQGIGAHLIQSAFEESRKRGLPVLYAYLGTEEHRKEVCPDEEAFLSDFGMEKVKVMNKNSPIFSCLVPKERSGSTLYRADVETYFRIREDMIRLEDPFLSVVSG